jgi:hypothetical protein
MNASVRSNFTTQSAARKPTAEIPEYYNNVSRVPQTFG